MKLKQYFISIIIIIVYFANFGCSQKLTIGKGSNETLSRQHLAFESNMGDSLLYYKGFSVIYSYTYNLPRYVFNLLTVDQLISNIARPPVKRSSSFYPYNLPNGSLSATNKDYSKSGYDRGHMVPAGDFVWNKELKDETFYYTNINPQVPTLNRGIWANLEKRIRDKVIGYNENGYVITGAVFNYQCNDKIGPNGICVPVAFFKIVYFNSHKKMFAFLFDNTIDSFVGDITDFQVTVDLIEQITNEDFFDLLNDTIEKKMESIIMDFND